MFVIALEGCSHAGKTTLIKNLKERLNSIIPLPDYVTFAGGDDKVPRAPAESVEEEIQSLNFFLNLDKQRWVEKIEDRNKNELVVADRSFHTLLAHRFAIEKLTGMKVFDMCCEIVGNETNLLKPDLIFYLDTPQDILNQRYTTRISSVPVDGHTKNYNLTEKMKLIFNKSEYNELFRKYFLPHLRHSTTPIIVLDGSLSADEVADYAFLKIQALQL
jgi:thymidylate kinase